MRRALVALLGMALLVTACTAGGTTGGTTGGNGLGPRPSSGGGPILLAGSGLQSFDACADFLEYVISNALELVGPYGLEGYYFGPQPWPMMAVAEDAAAGGELRASTAGVDYSTTNVQEAGVDEPDIAKTDGDRILAVAQGALHYVDVSGSRPVLRGSLPLESGWGHQMLLAGDRVLLMTTQGLSDIHPRLASEISSPDYYSSQVTVIQEIDISNPSQLELTRTLYIDGAYVSARMVGDTARVVVRSFPTGLVFEYPQGGGLRAERQAEERNRQIVRDSTVENWIPYYVLEDHVAGTTMEGALVGCEQAAHPREFSGLGMLSVLTIDVSDGLSPGRAVGVLAGGETIYASTDSLYVATNQWIPWTILDERDAEDVAAGMTTEIHKFDISDPNQATYLATGTVPGFLLSQWSMSEYEGHLRVASTDRPGWWGWGPAGESQSYVTALRESNGELVEVGQVSGLGKGEQIFAVRFIDDVGYVVTFRQTDPLYTIDLSDPTRPTVLGELKILGYSAYLHPLGDGLLLGIGQDATEEGRTVGTQISVFDVSDLKNPDRLYKLTIDDGHSEVEWDHKAFLYWAQTGLAVMPVQTWRWDDSTGQEDWFQGAIGFTVDRDSGIDRIGTITHMEDGKDYYDWNAQIRRSIVVGDVLYTVSEAGIMASEVGTLDELIWVAFEGAYAIGG